MRWVLVILGLLLQAYSLYPIYKSWKLMQKNKNNLHPSAKQRSKMITTILTGAGCFAGGFLLWFLPTLLHGAGMM